MWLDSNEETNEIRSIKEEIDQKNNNKHRLYIQQILLT